MSCCTNGTQNAKQNKQITQKNLANSLKQVVWLYIYYPQPGRTSLSPKACLAALMRLHFELSLPFCSWIIGVCIWFDERLTFFDKHYKWHALLMSFPAVSTAAGFDNWLSVPQVFSFVRVRMGICPIIKPLVSQPLHTSAAHLCCWCWLGVELHIAGMATVVWHNCSGWTVSDLKQWIQ